MKLLNTKFIFASLAFFVFSGSLLNAESIWSKRTEGHSLLFYDTRARNVGDLVTIIISQQTDVDNSEDRAMNKSTNAGTKLDLDTQAGGGFGTQAANAALEFGSTSNRNFEGGSNYRSEQGFTDRVTVTVIEVMPNGNLVLSGQRDVQVAGDVRSLVVSGTVRQIDLSTGNSVDSRFISDFRLTYEGTGPEQAFARQGWLGRRVNNWWPF